MFWLIFILFGFICFYGIFYNFNSIYNDPKSDQHTHEMSNKIRDNIYFLLFLSILGGLIVGGLAIGNGFLIIPLMLHLGYDTKEAVSTSTLLIVFGSFSSTIAFIFSVHLLY